ncbi:type IV pilus assembly protein PilM [Verrucomicrobiaceae bacterium R5-34]|uniref:Type IV pilus assembly protein PilM n=1 Tax=Oceaniferula flava TaxID=2800421 RepID=A0AAE2VAR1_9BACT|nr:type IV pilus assembly protein PilM [Oceaniferula flavus]MBK1829392.1 type IV pilus assembly protein PilM [Verrucomicrobiaceae bacterium R5-34]MBK1853620.1 type IV pilus assembly protein PilM [Oceaniferula flavus]MBM1134925.1 type IV pilus assembly protein PilM [Oceaniferula flavus]
MAEAQATVALNIGSQRISMGVFEPSKNGGLILKKYESSSILADPAAEMARLPQIRVAISELADTLKVGKSKLRYAISGQSVFTRFIKLPPIEDDNIEQLVAFEAQQHVPFPIDEVIWDWQLLESGAGEKEVALVAIKGDALNDMNDIVMESGLGTAEVDASPMALYNALRYNYPELEETTLLIDIGAKTCNLIYLEGNRMFTRSVAVGGASVTTAIAKEYGVSFAEAESQKCSNGMVALNTAHTSELDEATAALATVIRNALGKLPAEIARTTNYFRSQHGGSAPKRVMLAGGGANLPHVADFFQEKLRLPVEFFNPLKRISVGKGVDVDRIAAEAHLLGELVGLGLRGIDQAALEIDLVPDVVSRERDTERRKPILIGASAVLLLGLAAWAGFNVWKNGRMGEEEKALQAKVADLESYAAPLKKLSKREENLNVLSERLVNAQNARVLWVDIWDDLAHHFTSDTVWLADLDPVVGYSANGEGAADNAQSVIVSDFTQTVYGQSSLTKLKVAPPAPTSRKKSKRAAPPAPPAPMVNAIRIKGFWRGKGGYNEVYKLLDRLRADSKFFEVQPTEKLGLTLPTSLAEGSYAAPFEVTLVLKRPIPAPTPPKSQ